MAEENVQDVIDMLTALQADEGVPKKVKDILGELIQTLKGDGELSMKINKCLDELDQLADDINMQPFVRTQIWNASSLLEKMNHDS